uniref:Uncharacterized protein n=1 Tax=viral metagenome TaxID=1070528 RepID=A0A6C0KFU2_9ZZZZ
MGSKAARHTTLITNLGYNNSGFNQAGLPPKPVGGILPRPLGIGKKSTSS